MGITMIATGAFRETGASFFFIPKGALTHHLVVTSSISLDLPQSGRSRSFRCSSSPHETHFVGLSRGPHYRKVISVSVTVIQLSGGYHLLFG